MTLPRVLLTDPLHPDAHARLATWAEIAQLPDGLSRAQSDTALREAVKQAQGLVVRRLLPADLFDGPNALRCVMRQGVGLDFIPVERATANGIPVGNTPAVNANAVAEYVFAALLAHSRQLAAFDASVRAGDWAARTQAGARTHELRGRTLGLVGYGAIGQRIGAIATQGFGMSLAVCTGTPSKVPAGIATLAIEALFAASDVVVIACPLTPQTRGLVNAAVLAHARPGAVLVNVGRGPVLREDDLAAALAEGRLAGAVLDVFQTQPLPADSALRRHPGVLLTPHLAGLTQEAERAMGLLAVDTLAALLLRGERPPNIVNPEVFAATTRRAPDRTVPHPSTPTRRHPLKITRITAVPLSYRLPEGKTVTMGIGSTLKRDCIIIRVETSEGITGYGEAHPGRSPGAIVALVHNTLQPLLVGMNATDVVGAWQRVHRMQLSSHGLGAGTCLALSGIDMALWDIRGKAAKMPLYELLGGSHRRIPAYAGGIALGYQPAEAMAEEAQSYIEQGYKAVKLRIGDTVKNDIARVRKVREVLGEDIDILTDANTAYTIADVRRVLPALADIQAGWLEEPFACNDFASYREAAKITPLVPIAAGENHFTRFEFGQMLDAGAVQVWQPDLSKSGGITEGVRIAAMASAFRIPVHAHSSATGLNHAATLHFLAATENAGYFEACVSKFNPFRDMFGSTFAIGADGCVEPPQGHGLGIEVDESMFDKYPMVDGPGYVVKF